MGYGYENRRILELIVSIGNPFNNEIPWGLTDNNILFTRGHLMEMEPSFISKPSAKECSLIERCIMNEKFTGVVV